MITRFTYAPSFNTLTSPSTKMTQSLGASPTMGWMYFESSAYIIFNPAKPRTIMIMNDLCWDILVSSNYKFFSWPAFLEHKLDRWCLARCNPPIFPTDTAPFEFGCDYCLARVIRHASFMWPDLTYVKTYWSLAINHLPSLARSLPPSSSLWCG